MTSNNTHAIFKIGKSRLHFIKKQKSYPYHFAINISGNNISEALIWLKKELEFYVLKITKLKIFKNWNAEAIYFYDKDKNIVELIARKYLDYKNKTNFDSESLIEISEIGIPVENIQDTFRKLEHNYDLNMYNGNFNRFCAIGDEQGLFICINKKIKKWFPTNDKAFSADFTIKFINVVKEYKLKFEDGKIKS